MTPSIVTEIVVQTNSYASHINISKWKDLTVEEFWRFLSLNILTGVVQKTSLKDYWSTNALIATHYFGEIMSRDRSVYVIIVDLI